MSTKEKGKAYVLDGIQTAMVWTHEVVGDFVAGPTSECPCGWVHPPSAIDHLTDNDYAALRFHFAWCPKARGED